MKFADELFNPETVFAPLDAARPVVVYGAGRTGDLVATALIHNGITPAAFIDNYFAGNHKNGIPVFPLAETPAPAADTQVIVAVFNFQEGSSFKHIRKQLQGRGFERIVSFERFFQIYSDLMPDSIFWLTRRSFYLPYRTEIEAAGELFADDKSRHLYRAIMEHRLTADDECLLEKEKGIQYLPDDVPLPPQPWCFVDVGAFTGDTVESFLHSGISLKRVIAFEPDAANFKKLVKTAHGLPPSLDLLCLPLGVGSRTETACLTPNDGASAVQINPPTTTLQATHIQLTSLDDMLHGAAPNYIKLDVEGFETEALMGMTRTIVRSKPALAISAYHRPQDIYSLPLLVASWPGVWRMYLRTHCEHTFDTVLYAIPDLQ